MKVNWIRLIASIIICEMAGVIGSIATYPKIPTWYATLVKPAFAPPNFVFGPVWTTLFALMGIALYLILEKGFKDSKVKTAVYVFVFQFALNVLWSFLFFGLESPFLGLVCIIAMWLAIAATIWKFYGIDRKAAYLLIPYIAWVSFATLVNYAVWALN